MTQRTGADRRVRDAAATRALLIDAARSVTCEAGVAGASARVIAEKAGVNQALVFYHFHTVVELIEAASNHFVDQAVARYRDALAGISTIDGLVALARELHKREKDVGNVAFMAQILAGAGQDAAIRRAADYATTAWTTHTRSALSQVLTGTAALQLVDIDGLTDLVTASLIGLELYATATNVERAFDALAKIGGLVDVLTTGNPVTRKIITVATKRR